MTNNMKLHFVSLARTSNRKLLFVSIASINNLKLLFVSLTMLITVMANAQPAGVFQQQADIGNPRIKGDIRYDNSSQSYTLKGSGYNIWFNRDEFRYAYNYIKGDFILTANISFQDTAGDPHRKTGWMVRQSNDPQSAHVSATMHGDGLNMIQWRELRGAYMRDPEDQIRFPKKKVQVLQLERKGKRFIMRIAPFGEPLQLVGEKLMPDMPDSIMAGLFVCSHDSNSVTTMRAWNVRIDKPFEDNYNPDRSGYKGSRLEYIDVSNGLRKLVHESTGRFEAPNYMPDGKALLFNEGGSLYTVPESGGVPQKLNTGFANRNNNDHGISFDGKTLAISHHRDGLPGGGSTVYVLPITGGEPRLVTEKTPSYWHGWSPDAKFVLVIGQRGANIYNIYRVSVKDGKEENLTKNTEGHVDGSEYSPDGNFIYFNWTGSGTMQLWRMKPDGTQKEQLTFDEYNNWFPHISPDGKWIAFISFLPDIDPSSHPPNKRVMLRLMPVSGGAPRVIAYLYGGQGTINVPSWSPDSRKLAFVSYSGRD
jgi:TolB protein